MSKEAFGGPMNRRDFLKTAGTAGASLAMGQGVEAQDLTSEKAVYDYLQEINWQAQEVKINFPDTGKEITPEVEELFLSIGRYQNSFLVGQTIGRNLGDGGDATPATYDLDPLLLAEAKTDLWQRLKRVDSSLGEYNTDNFFRALFFILPRYLSEHGIYIYPQPTSAIERDSSGRALRIQFNEVQLNPLVVGRVERDEILQGGESIQRDILYITGPVLVEGQPVVRSIPYQNGQIGFLNIIIFENDLRRDLDTNTNQFLINFKQESSPVLLARTEEMLKRENSSQRAAEVGMMKIIQRFGRRVEYKEFEEQTVVHETGHLVHQTEDRARSIWPSGSQISLAEGEKNILNIRIHSEIDAFLEQLKYGPLQWLTLLHFLQVIKESSSSGTPQTYNKAEEWIGRQIVGLVSQDPKHYGIDIENIPVDRENQILSQFDALVDRPKLIDALIDKISKFHSQHLDEDIFGNLSPAYIRSIEDQIRHVARWIPKIVLPGVGVLGAGAYGLKKLSERKARIAAEEATMSRGQRKRAWEKTQNHKKKP